MNVKKELKNYSKRYSGYKYEKEILTIEKVIKKMSFSDHVKFLNRIYNTYITLDSFKDWNKIKAFYKTVNNKLKTIEGESYFFNDEKIAYHFRYGNNKELLKAATMDVMLRSKNKSILNDIQSRNNKFRAGKQFRFEVKNIIRLRGKYGNEPKKREIELWLLNTFRYLNKNQYIIDDNLEISVFYDIFMTPEQNDIFEKIKSIPYKFKAIIGDFIMTGSSIDNTKNFPKYVFGSPFDATFKDSKGNPNRLPSYKSNFDKPDDKPWDEILEDMKGGKKLIKEKENDKKYRLISRVVGDNLVTYRVSEIDLHECIADYYLLIKSHSLLGYRKGKLNDSKGNRYKAKFYCKEEDDGLLEVGHEWTEEEFKNRDPKKDYEEYLKREEKRKKEEALSKLSDEERELLGVI